MIEHYYIFIINMRKKYLINDKTINDKNVLTLLRYCKHRMNRGSEILKIDFMRKHKIYKVKSSSKLKHKHRLEFFKFQINE